MKPPDQRFWPPTGGLSPIVLIGLVAVALIILGASLAAIASGAGGGSLATARSGARAVLLPDGTVLVEGGTPAAGANLSSAERYSPASNAWAPAGSMATGRAAHSATLLPTGRVLVAGGFGGSPTQTILKSAELYDPGANAWSAAADMGSIREDHSATLLPAGKVLVAGGIGLTNGLKTTEIYDPATNAWAPAAPMTTGRYSHTATRLRGGRVLVVGGNDATNHPTATAETYTPSSNTWAAAASLATGRVRHTATLLLDGRVLVTGGDDSSGDPIAAAEIYNPANNTWSTAGALSTARSGHTATLLRDGRILVEGGVSSSGDPVASNELYSPRTNAWAAGPSLASVRTAHTATLLLGGRVLASGGAGPSGALASSELSPRVGPTSPTRRPIIAYVDAAGHFSLYDAELGVGVAAPVLPTGITRFGTSLDGRYVVYSDPGTKTIHLYDRRARSEVPLPGINVYANPSGLTVSNAGLVAFDNNSNGPALLYNSKTGSFLDVGLAADNGHRQTRLSADGHFLATTCLSHCITPTGGDADPFVQDLRTRTNIPFPDDLSAPNKDEEHPCIDSRGRLVGIDAGNPVTKAIFLYDRTAMAPVSVPLLNDPTRDETHCALDASGTHLAAEDNGGAVRLLDITADTLVPLPARITGVVSLSDPLDLTPPHTTITSGPSGIVTSPRAEFRFVSSEPGSSFGCRLDGGPFTSCASPKVYARLARGRHTFAVRAIDSAGNIDPTPAARTWTIKPGVSVLRITGLRISPATFRSALAGGAVSGKGPRGTEVRYALSAAATVRFTVQRRATGRRLGHRCVARTRRTAGRRACTRLVIQHGRFSHRGGAGTNTFHFSGRLAGRRLRPGRYRLVAIPVSAVGKGRARAASFRITRG